MSDISDPAVSDADQPPCPPPAVSDDPCSGLEIGGLNLDMLSKLDLGTAGDQPGNVIVIEDDLFEETPTVEPEVGGYTKIDETRPPVTLNQTQPTFAPLEPACDDALVAEFKMDGSAPSSLLLVVRDDLHAVAASAGRLRLAARSVDKGDVLHTFIVDKDANRDAPRPHGDYNVPVCLVTDDGEADGAAVADPGTVQITMNGDAISAVVISHDEQHPHRTLEVGFLPGKDELFSRNKGILETDLLAGKTVAIIGLGSGGGTVAVELAKAGVGKFILIDNERLELCNVARHVLDIRDVGRLKTNAMADAVKSRNPFATVVSSPMDVVSRRKDLKKLLHDEKADLLVMATDTKVSRGVLNELALELGVVAIFGRTIVRAAGGDVLRVRPISNPSTTASQGKDGTISSEHPCLNWSV